jgi:hypothetical protein
MLRDIIPRRIEPPPEGSLAIDGVPPTVALNKFKGSAELAEEFFFLAATRATASDSAARQFHKDDGTRRETASTLSLLDA